MTMLSTQSVLFIVACMAISNPMKISVPRPNTKKDNNCVKEHDFSPNSQLTEGPDPEVEAGPGHFVPGDVGAAESAEAADAPDLRVAGIVGGQLLPGVPGHPGAVVQQHRDVDAHDGDDAPAVEVHHEEVLEVERPDLVVHHLDQAEREHQEDEDLAVHRAQRHPQLGEGLPPVPENPREGVQVQPLRPILLGGQGRITGRPALPSLRDFGGL